MFMSFIGNWKIWTPDIWWFYVPIINCADDVVKEPLFFRNINLIIYRWNNMPGICCRII